MNRLFAAIPVTLGESASGSGAACALANLEDGRVAVVWLDPDGRIVQSTGSLGENKWSKPAAVLSDSAAAGFSTLSLTGDHRAGWRLAARKAGGVQSVWHRRSWKGKWTPQTGAGEAAEPAATGLPEGALAWKKAGATRVALRPGRRVPGVKPRFPAAGLVISFEQHGIWQDVGFADDVPDVAVEAAALAAEEDRLVAAYVAPDGRGRKVCRVIQFSTKPAASSATPTWRELPAYPQAPGVAGLLAGAHDGVLIAAGGANFPDRPPWEGGKKITHDSIYVLMPGEKSWRPAGRLPEPRGYSAVVSIPGGVLVAGGENASKIFMDTLLYRWDGKKVRIDRFAPDLPEPITMPVAALLDGSVYLAGGNGAGTPRVSQTNFWRLDLKNPSAGWQVLPTWPGPARSQAAMAALDGAIYLVSGLEVRAGADGKTQAIYLADAYRYRPGGAWEKLPDPPWSTIASPTPAPVTTAPARVFLLGGVDGRQVGHLPRELRWLPTDILYFDVARHEWRLWGESWPDSVVTVPAVAVGPEWFITSGEIMGGVRTTNSWAWRIDEPPVPGAKAPAPGKRKGGRAP